jgi:hypothetical protein
MKIELKGIEIAMDGKIIRLSVSEARQLQKQLNDFVLRQAETVPVFNPYTTATITHIKNNPQPIGEFEKEVSNA